MQQTATSHTEKIVNNSLNGADDNQKEIARLVSGKDEQQRIVSVEIQDNSAILFIENPDGSITQERRKNRFWILSNQRRGNATKLGGDLYYKWGYQFSSKKDWYSAIQGFKKSNIDIYTAYDPKEQFLIKDGVTYLKGMKHTEPSILSFDIESTGLFHNEDSKVLLISNTYRFKEKVVRRLFSYDEYNSPSEMLIAWTDWIRSINPSIIAGHNIYSYDLPYLNYIAEQNGITLDLGRDGSALTISNKASKFRIDGSREQEYHKCRVYGRELIDTYFLAVKHDIATKKYESYGLKSIIKAEGLERSDRQYYDSSQIRFNYTNPEEWKKIKEYCIHDADDALAVYDLTAPATFYLTQSVPKPFQTMVESATGSQINAMMIRSYLQEGHSIPKPDPVAPFEGAISFGNAGTYRNVHKVDVASLYPSIILSCKVFDEDKDPKGNFLKIMEKFTEERLKNKKLAKDTGDAYYEGLQNAQKIVINSGYGFMGASGLHFNSIDAAEFITRTGRDILNIAIEWAKSSSYIIPNGDTDSISYTKANQSEITEEERQINLKQLNKLCPDRIVWEDDGYYRTVCILKAKNYVLQTQDGKVKIKGSALKATGKSPAMKEMINRIIQSILDHQTNQLDIYHEYVREAVQIKDIKRWSTRKTISEKTLNSERTNEARIREAIEGTEIVEGDRVHMYFKDKTTLALADKFDGQYDFTKMLKSCYDTINTFDSILDMTLFKNYTLKRSQEPLQGLLNA